MHKKRIQALTELFQKEGCDAFLVDDPVNLYYLTGLELSAGQLLLHSKGALLLVDGRYIESCKKNSPVPVQLIEKPNESLTTILQDLSFIKILGFNSETTSVKKHQSLQKLISTLNAEGKNISLKPLDNPIAILRSIKDEQEIKLLRNAANLGSEGYDFVCSLLKEGISEVDVANELEIFWKKRGSKSVAFEPIIAFGINSSMPHYRAGKTSLKKGDTVLIDIGVNIQHYHSDMTRVVFFGQPLPEILKIHRIVSQAQKAAFALCKPGILIGQLDQAARDVIVKEGYGKEFSHGLGHGVGLEIHEAPSVNNTSANKDTPLQKGMIITIEPGIYLPNIGGVRIEDTIVITDKGYESLTNRPVDPIVLE